jgi:uncharacterized membrane protein YeaQ/YmgE (transglycosylase-associated protein family)
MSLLVFVLLLAVFGLIIGGLARLAVPGPDPMSVLATIALGISGSFLGGLIARLLGFGSAGLLVAVIGAVLILVAYRKWIQGRPLTGPRARLRD